MNNYLLLLPSTFSISYFRLTDLLKELDNLKKDSDGDVETLIKTFEAESVTGDMTQIYQKIKDKRMVIIFTIDRLLTS